LYTALFEGFICANSVFLTTIGKDYINYIIFCISLSFHLANCWFWIDYMDLGIMGGGIAQSITNLFHSSISFIYIFVIQPEPECATMPDWSIFSGIWSYLKFTLPIVIITCSMSWCIQIQNFICSRMDPDIYSQYVVSVSSSTISFSIAKGTQSASAIVTGKEIVKGNIKRTKKIIVVSFIVGQLLQVIVFIILIVFRYQVASLFTANKDLIEGSSVAIVWMTFLGFFFIIENNFTGIFKGLGKQTLATFNYIFSLYLVQLSTLAILFNCFDIQFYSIIYSKFFGTICSSTIFIILLSYFNLNQIRVESIARLMNDSKKEKYEIEDFDDTQSLSNGGDDSKHERDNDENSHLA